MVSSLSDWFPKSSSSSGSDPACRATLDVLTVLEEPAHFIDENLRYLVLARMVNLSLKHGNSDGSCVAYVNLGWLVGPRFGDQQTAFRFGKLGLDLLEKRGLERFRARVSQCFGYFVIPWSRHLRTGVGLLRHEGPSLVISPTFSSGSSSLSELSGA